MAMVTNASERQYGRHADGDSGGTTKMAMAARRQYGRHADGDSGGTTKMAMVAKPLEGNMEDMQTVTAVELQRWRW